MKLFSLCIPRLIYGEFIDEIQGFLIQNTRGKNQKNQAKKQLAIFTPNPEICLKTLQDSEFTDVLQRADYLTSDGIGLFTGYQIMDSKLPLFLQIPLIPIYILRSVLLKKRMQELYGDRICGSDLTKDLLAFAQRQGISIAILDVYRPKDNAKCKAQETFLSDMKHFYPDLMIDVYLDRADSRADIFQKIAQSPAQIFFSTIGMKRQEQSVLQALESCPNIMLGLGVGSSFDYITGFQKRAPDWMRSMGVEWLYRIVTGPQKMKRVGRLCAAIIVFPIMVCVHKHGPAKKEG